MDGRPLPLLTLILDLKLTVVHKMNAAAKSTIIVAKRVVVAEMVFVEKKGIGFIGIPLVFVSFLQNVVIQLIKEFRQVMLVLANEIRCCILFLSCCWWQGLLLSVQSKRLLLRRRGTRRVGK